MPPSRASKTTLPSKDDVRRFLQDSTGKIGRRELARAFGVTGSQRAALNAIVRDLVDEGLIEGGRGRRRKAPTTEGLPSVTVVEVVEIDVDGEPYARPLGWHGETEPPRIIVVPDRRSPATPGVGDRVLARLKKVDGEYQAHVMRFVGTGPSQVLGVYRLVGGQGRLQPTDRKLKHEFVVAGVDSAGASPGELVLADVLSGRRIGLKRARVTERLGHLGESRSFSLISLHTHGIPTVFSAAALAEANAATLPARGARADLTHLPLVTIDPDDARDFDDAVWAAADDDPTNAGGWHIVVAIADVAHFVRPASALDNAARERGNSVYFPDRVVPMLPEALSSELCSLKPGVRRPCLAVHMWFDSEGRRTRHRFERATMRSAARLTYGQAQSARDGRADEATGPLADSVIAPLFDAYVALQRERMRRKPLDIAMPEFDIRIDDASAILGVTQKPRHDSHRLIEEFMIQANVAAAESLTKSAAPGLYRVHDAPHPEKVNALRDLLKGLGYTLAKGQVLRPAHFNQILAKAAGTPHLRLLNEVVLRCQAQALYSPADIGHFGLNLRRYTHFTSPIRRYADLVAHRALITSLGLGEGGLDPTREEDYETLGEHISVAERRAMAAERDAVSRFMSAYMTDRIGAQFAGRISGVARFGLFVALDETGAEGIVPMRSLGDDYYHHDEARHALVGRASKRVYRLGDRVEVRLHDADPVTDSLVFELLGDAGFDPPPARKQRKPGAAKRAQRSRWSPRL